MENAGATRPTSRQVPSSGHHLIDNRKLKWSNPLSGCAAARVSWRWEVPEGGGVCGLTTNGQREAADELRRGGMRRGHSPDLTFHQPNFLRAAKHAFSIVAKGSVFLFPSGTGKASRFYTLTNPQQRGGRLVCCARGERERKTPRCGRWRANRVSIMIAASARLCWGSVRFRPVSTGYVRRNFPSFATLLLFSLGPRERHLQLFLVSTCMLTLLC